MTFPDALAKLLRARKIRVPAGLKSASPASYAGQPAEFVERLSGLADEDLLAHAESIAGYDKRREARARRAWDESPLIGELRRRKLSEPAKPTRVVGATFPVKKPLAEWTDGEILAAAKEWSRRGRKKPGARGL